MIIELLFLLCIFISVQIYSQKIVYGTIPDSLSFVKNAHIINLSSKIETFSNDNGAF